MTEDLPAFLRISQDERRAAWERYRAKLDNAPATGAQNNRGLSGPWCGQARR